MVDRCGAPRGGKAAQNNDKQEDSRHFHNCGLSIPRCAALRSYQNQSSWQVVFYFFVQAIYFANVPGVPNAAPRRGYSVWQLRDGLHEQGVQPCHSPIFLASFFFLGFCCFSFFSGGVAGTSL
jgi:hypothetical protein